jgi:hypothetical protein
MIHDIGGARHIQPAASVSPPGRAYRFLGKTLGFAGVRSQTIMSRVLFRPVIR